MLGTPEVGEDGEEEGMDQAKKVQFLFAKIDANKDGAVNLDEFIDICNQDEHLAKLLTMGSASS